MKDAYIVAGICLLALVAGIGFMVYSGSIGGTGNLVQFTELASGSQSEITTRTNYRIQNQEQLAALWAAAHGESGADAPQIDFDKHEVIAVFDGSHATGGYSIRVLTIEDRGVSRVISIEHIAPDPECSVASVQTSPFQFVTVPKMRSNMVIERQNIESVFRCP